DPRPRALARAASRAERRRTRVRRRRRDRASRRRDGGGRVRVRAAGARRAGCHRRRRRWLPGPPERRPPVRARGRDRLGRRALAGAARFADWWPGIDHVESAVRRAVAPGALWQVEGPNRVSLLRRSPQLSGTLLVLDVVPQRRLAFHLNEARVGAELELETNE